MLALSLSLPPVQRPLQPLGPAAPVAGDDALVVAEGATAAVDVAANDFDANLDTLQVTHLGGAAVAPGGPPATLPSGAAAALQADGRTIVYDPVDLTAADSPDAFSYIVSDGALTDAALVTVTILAPAVSVTWEDGQDAHWEDAQSIAWEG